MRSGRSSERANPRAIGVVELVLCVLLGITAGASFAGATADGWLFAVGAIAVVDALIAMELSRRAFRLAPVGRSTPGEEKSIGWVAAAAFLMTVLTIPLFFVGIAVGSRNVPAATVIVFLLNVVVLLAGARLIRAARVLSVTPPVTPRDAAR
ncbi:hypothetical protein [Microbacterium sp. bgisy203]|uniref:hypothetical protein n=1 Tax=Microbacterium sp. bgisy203 TaxID=3413799 RepID=UPI003D72AEAE